MRKQVIAQTVVLCVVVINCTNRWANSEDFDIFNNIAGLRKRVYVVYVDTWAIPVDDSDS
jgi:hypothetical protein